MSAAEIASINTDLHTFARKQVQIIVLGTIETAYKTIIPVDQNDLEFLIPADNDNNIRLDIQLYDRGKLVSGWGNNVDASDHTGVTKNFLDSLFSQSTVVLNDTTITKASEYYNNRSYFENLLTYGNDTSATHRTNAHWYRDTGETLPCNPTIATEPDVSNRDFNTH